MQLTPATLEAIDALAPTGTLRAAINLSNFLLVTGEDGHGAPVGPSPGMAIALAETLGVQLEMITYPSCLLYTSPSPRDGLLARMPCSA